MSETSNRHPLVTAFENATSDLTPVPVDDIGDQVGEKILVDMGDGNHWLLKENKAGARQHLEYMASDVEVREEGGLRVTRRLAVTPHNLYDLFALFPQANRGEGEAAMYGLGFVDGSALSAIKETPREEILPYVAEGHYLKGVYSTDNSTLYIPNVVSSLMHDRFKSHDFNFREALDDRFINSNFKQPRVKLEGDLADCLEQGNFKATARKPSGWSFSQKYYYDLELHGRFSAELRPTSEYDKNDEVYFIDRTTGGINKLVGISGEAVYQGENYYNHTIESDERVADYDLGKAKILELARQNRDKNGLKIEQSFVGLIDLIGRNTILLNQLAGEPVITEELFKTKVFEGWPMQRSYRRMLVDDIKDKILPSDSEIMAKVSVRSLRDWVLAVKGQDGRQIEPSVTGMDEVYQKFNPPHREGELLA